MNAKYMIKLLEKCSADARACYPNDAELRSMYFARALGTELAVVGEPCGPVVANLMSPRTNANYIADRELEAGGPDIQAATR